ncbi:MAG: hypothetical protein JJT89_13255 [Nitriliruptoraceae bacterium]|nr:hypothetical protein [Nitriliruptoraceae bacterium]
MSATPTDTPWSGPRELLRASVVAAGVIVLVLLLVAAAHLPWLLDGRDLQREPAAAAEELDGWQRTEHTTRWHLPWLPGGPPWLVDSTYDVDASIDIAMTQLIQHLVPAPDDQPLIDALDEKGATTTPLVANTGREWSLRTSARSERIHLVGRERGRRLDITAEPTAAGTSVRVSAQNTTSGYPTR